MHHDSTLVQALLLQLHKTNANAEHFPFKSHYQYTCFLALAEVTSAEATPAEPVESHGTLPTKSWPHHAHTLTSSTIKVTSELDRNENMCGDREQRHLAMDNVEHVTYPTIVILCGSAAGVNLVSYIMILTQMIYFL